MRKLLNAAIGLGCVTIALTLVDFCIAQTSLFRARQLTYPPHLSVRIKTQEFTYQLMTNEEGLRDRPIAPKGPNELRLLFIGDAVTEGPGLNPEERYTEWVERDLSLRLDRRVRTINAGIANRGPTHYFQFLKERGLSLSPDWIVLAFSSGDLLETELPREWPDPMVVEELAPNYRFLPALRQLWAGWGGKKAGGVTGPAAFAVLGEEAAKRNIPPEEVAQWEKRIPPEVKDGIARGKLQGRILANALLDPRLYVNSFELASTEAQAKWEAQEKLIVSAKRIADEHGAKLALLYVPNRVQYSEKAQTEWNLFVRLGGVVKKDWMFGQSEWQKKLDEVSRQQRIPYLDLTSTLRTSPDRDSLTFHYDGHLNQAGNAVVGKAVSQWLRDVAFKR